MTPNDNNYFVIIIRIFSANDTFFQKYRFLSPLISGLPSIFHRIYSFTNLLHINACIRSVLAPSFGSIYSSIVINRPIFSFTHAICNHFGDFYFLHGIGIGVFSPFSIQ